MNPSFEDSVPVFRRRPGMYLGSAHERGVEYLISELVAIGLDFFMAGEATQVSVTHDGPVITIEDDGPGLPFDRPGDYGMSLAEDYFITIHRTPTGGGNSPHPQLNRLGVGVGLAAVSALSKYVEVRSHCAGYLWELRLELGRIISSPKKSKSTGRGTRITFQLDPDVMSALVPSVGRSPAEVVRHGPFGPGYHFAAAKGVLSRTFRPGRSS